MCPQESAAKAVRAGVGRPTLHDRVTRLGLHLAKLGSDKHEGNPRVFYEGYFTDKNVDESIYDLRHRLRREAVISELVNLPSGAVVVDIGSGVGDIVAAVAPNCKRIGIEYSGRDIELARKPDACGVWFIRGSAVNLPLASESVDAVIFLEVLEHLADDRPAMREIARVLKPGRRLIISVPSTYYFHDYLTLIGHYRHYTRQQLVELLGEANFQVIRFIDHYPMLQTLHYYPFVLFAAIHRVLNRCGLRCESLYARRVVGALYRLLSRSLFLLKRERSQHQLACDERSTFVVAHK